MKKAFNILFPALTFMLCMYSTISFSKDLSLYKTDLAKLTQIYQNIARQNQEITNLQNRLNEKGGLIANLKSNADSAFLSKLQLQKQMQEAQTLSIELDKRYTQRSQMQDQLANLKKSLLRSIESDLSKAYLLDKKDTTALMNLHKKVYKLQEAELTEQARTFPATEDTLSDSTMEQWIVLQDLQLYTQDLINQTEKQLAYEQQQKVLRKELSHLMNEEVFFGEQGFIQGTARKQNNSATTTATSSENTDTEEQQDNQEPIDGEPPLEDPEDPSVGEDPEIDTGDDLGDDAETVSEDTIDDIEISQNFDDIDPKNQALMLGGVLTDSILQPSDDEAYQNDLKIQGNIERGDYLQNPNEIANAIISLSPHAGESKEDFFQRKILYLNEILKKLKKNSAKVKTEIETFNKEGL